MKNLTFVSTVFALFAVSATVLATPPGETVNPNGFPSGAHFNLNLNAKRPEFNCPAPEYDPTTGEQLFGNVVFLPEYGENIEIVMISGKNKGKRRADVTELQVIDWCTDDFDGNRAEIRLPHNPNGYHVYARPLATPQGEPTLSIVPDLLVVEDEAGNDLVYLGLVTKDGFATPYVEFTRKKGKSTAIDITGLFLFSGSVCYFDQLECPDPVTCAAQALCCVDDEPIDAPDGIYESCVTKGEDACLEGEIEVLSYCQTFLDEWVFNIGDLVYYLWGIDNDGVKRVNVRFYPNAD
jgi:hypothetical protein